MNCMIGRNFQIIFIHSLINLLSQSFIVNPKQISTMQEYLFSKNELEALIHDSPEEDMIAIRIAFESSSGEGNEFKAIITASAVSSGLPSQSDPRTDNGKDARTDDGKYLQTADVANFLSSARAPGHNKMPTFIAPIPRAAATVSGCPNPPGCKSPTRQHADI